MTCECGVDLFDYAAEKGLVNYDHIGDEFDCPQCGRTYCVCYDEELSYDEDGNAVDECPIWSVEEK